MKNTLDKVTDLTTSLDRCAERMEKLLASSKYMEFLIEHAIDLVEQEPQEHTKEQKN